MLDIKVLLLRVAILSHGLALCLSRPQLQHAF